MEHLKKNMLYLCREAEIHLNHKVPEGDSVAPIVCPVTAVFLLMSAFFLREKTFAGEIRIFQKQGRNKLLTQLKYG